jgi:methylenetetrahydrofolate--tRNA-(uracil-5-)-methyltransferase
MHRNTYLNSPKLLSPDYSLREDPNLFFAGQMTGVEGYIESTSSGWMAGVNAARRAQGKEPFLPEAVTVIGALSRYVSDPNVVAFQPMNANFGLVAPLGRKVKGGKAARNLALAEKALAYLDEIRMA